MIPNSVAFILKYYSLYNFHSLSSAKVGGKFIRCVILIFHVSLCTWCTINTLVYLTEMPAIMTRLDALYLLGYYCSCAMIYWLIIFKPYAIQSVQNAFWQNYLTIHNRFCFETEIKKRNNLITIVLLPVIDVVVFLIAVTNDHATRPSIKMMHFIYLDLCAHGMYFYVLHVKIIAFQLRQISMELKKIREFVTYRVYQQKRSVEQNHQWIKERLNWILNYYKIVYDMSDNVNRIFGWSHLALVLLSCYCIFSFLNFFYRQLEKKLNKFNFGLYYCFKQVLFFPPLSA